MITGKWEAKPLGGISFPDYWNIYNPLSNILNIPWTMLHINNNASSAIYTLEEYNRETAQKKKNKFQDIFNLLIIAAVGMTGLFFSLAV